MYTFFVLIPFQLEPSLAFPLFDLYGGIVL